MIALSTVSVAVSSFVDVVHEVERSRTYWADARRTSAGGHYLVT